MAQTNFRAADMVGGAKAEPALPTKAPEVAAPAPKKAKKVAEPVVEATPEVVEEAPVEEAAE